MSSKTSEKNAMSCRVFILVLLIGLLSIPAISQQFKEIPVDTSSELQIVLEEVAGHISIRGADRPFVTIDMKSETEANSELGLEISSNGKRVNIRGISTHSNRTYTITVPSQSSIVAHITRNQDDLSIRGVRGAIEINTRDADLQLVGVEGALLIHTLRGDVEAEFASSLNSHPGTISTGVGSINIRLPKETRRTLHIQCMEEELKSEVPLEKNFQALGDFRRVHATAKLHGGGPSLYISTIRGEVTISR